MSHISDLDSEVEQSSLIFRGVIRDIGTDRFNSPDGSLISEESVGINLGMYPNHDPNISYGIVVLDVTNLIVGVASVNGIVSLRVDKDAANQRGGRRNVFWDSEEGDEGIGLDLADYSVLLEPTRVAQDTAAGNPLPPFLLALRDRATQESTGGTNHFSVSELNKWYKIDGNSATDSVTGEEYTVEEIMNAINEFHP